MKLQSPLLVGVILLAGFLLANLYGQPQVDGKFVALEHSASPQWVVDLSVKPDTVAVGNLGMMVTIHSARSGYLTLFQLGTDGKEEVIFPNSLDQDNRIEADNSLTLPRQSWQWNAAAGNGRLLAVVSEKAVDTQSLQTSLRGQMYGAASAVYRELE